MAKVDIVAIEDDTALLLMQLGLNYTIKEKVLEKIAELGRNVDYLFMKVCMS